MRIYLFVDLGCRIPQRRIIKSAFLFVKFQENKLQTNNNNQFRSCARHELGITK